MPAAVPCLLSACVWAVLALGGCGLRVRTADGTAQPHSLTALHARPAPNPRDYPHLFSSQGRPYPQPNPALRRLDRTQDAAVVFHGFGRAGKRLVLARLLGDDTGPSSPDPNAVSLFAALRFRDRISALSVVDVPNADPCAGVAHVGAQVADVLLQVESRSLPLERVYIVADLSALDDDAYVAGLDRYVQELSRLYRSDDMVLVFNKADAVAGPEQRRRRALFDGHQIVVVSGRDCVGQLVDDLGGALGRPASDQSGDAASAHRIALRTSTDLAVAMLSSAQAAIGRTNTAPALWSRSYPIMHDADWSDRKRNLDGLRWVADWLRTGAKRQRLADRVQGFNPTYADSRSDYDGYVAYWTANRDEVERYLKRVETEKHAQGKIGDLDDLCRHLQDDLGSQLAAIQRAQLARRRIMVQCLQMQPSS